MTTVLWKSDYIVLVVENISFIPTMCSQHIKARVQQ